MIINKDYTGIVEEIDADNVEGLQELLDLKAPIDNPTFTGTVAGITKAMVDLGSVDNTSDVNKPVSNATTTQLNLKAPIDNPTFTGTVAGITKAMVGLSAVDNTSDADKPISNTTLQALNLKAPIDNPEFTGTVAGITKAMVGLGNVDNTSDINKPVSNSTQTALDLKSNLASPTFSGTATFTKADNYGQIELTDTKPVATGVGGGITLNGVYGGSGQITGLAHIKAKKSNATAGDYHGDLSLSVREHGGGAYTEIIKLKGEDLKTIVSGAMEVAGNINLPTGSEFQINGTAIGGGGGGGVCLESINEVLRGQTITTKNGDSIVLPNITAVVQPNQTGGYSILAAINGYIPPSGSKSVLLSLKFCIGWSGTNGSCNALFNCRIDGGGPTTIVKTSDSFIKSDRGMGEVGSYSIDCLINIDSSYTDSITEGKFSSWTTGKLFNFCCSRTITNGIPYIFSNNPSPYNTALLKFVEPIIKIEAYS